MTTVPPRRRALRACVRAVKCLRVFAPLALFLAYLLGTSRQEFKWVKENWPAVRASTNPITLEDRRFEAARRTLSAREVVGYRDESNPLSVAEDRVRFF